MVMGLNDEDRSEIIFFDLETTVPTRTGQRFAILEFGAILVCPKKLVELHSYSTLVRPTDVSLINSLSVRCNGITPDAVTSAPTFTEIADTVFDLLHGRIWAGHNILRFDCVRIREAFAEIGRAAPEPKGTIDSLALLTQRFGRRAGDMKMATLATYFGIGKQTHRSLDDVRMNLEVVKYCATVLFLESSLPDIFTENSWISPNAVTRSRRIMNDNAGQKREEEIHPIISLMTSNTNQGINPESLQSDDLMEDRCSNRRFDVCFPSTSEGSSGFLEPKEVSLPCITASLVPHNPRSQRIRFLHKDVNLQLRCHLKVRFGVNGKFLDFAGRPRLSFLADASPALCHVLDFCDSVAQKLVTDSEWKPVVIRKEGFFNFPTVRLHIPITYADSPRYETEIYKRDSCGVVEKLVFSRCDASEIEPLISSGASVDAYFYLDHYEYQQTAGIRLLAKKLLIHSSN